MPKSTDTLADEIIADVEQLTIAKDSVYAQLAAARTMLRNLGALGKLTEEQAAYVAERFPPRQRHTAVEVA